MSKELFIAEHDRLAHAYLEDNPTASLAQAYEATDVCAYDAMRERFADMADWVKQRAKDEGKWPPQR